MPFTYGHQSYLGLLTSSPLLFPSFKTFLCFAGRCKSTSRQRNAYHSSSAANPGHALDFLSASGPAFLFVWTQISACPLRGTSYPILFFSYALGPHSVLVYAVPYPFAPIRFESNRILRKAYRFVACPVRTFSLLFQVGAVRCGSTPGLCRSNRLNAVYIRRNSTYSILFNSTPLLCISVQFRFCFRLRTCPHRAGGSRK